MADVALNRSEFSMRLGIFLILSIISIQVAAGSTCFGTTSAGRLEDACKLPGSGSNYSAYSSLMRMSGRTYVHCDVRAVILDAYATLESNVATKVFVYGETGFKHGGQFKPHKTHQNGLSVDFMVPVLDSDGKSVSLPTNVLNKYGYDIDFTLDGRYEDLTIDYEAFAEHLAALKVAATNRGVGIWRVLFDPKMQGALKNTKAWPQISDLKFSDKRSWVRHDDHYHVDFVLPCMDP